MISVMVLGYSVTQSIKSTLTWYAYNQFNGVRLKRVSEIIQTGNVGKQDAGPWGGETKYMVSDLVFKLWDRGWNPILSRIWHSRYRRPYNWKMALEL